MKTKMKCWFCQQFFTIEDAISGSVYSMSACKNKGCLPYKVSYAYNRQNKCFRSQFQVNLFTNVYFVYYKLITKELEVVERTIKVVDIESDSNVPFESFKFKSVFKIPYDSISLTPKNAQTKLPILITFS